MEGDKKVNALETLKTYFGYDTFREGQEKIVEAILANRDVLAIMPTGAGKSICYQIPALILPGITLVISPLISLMQDQVKALNDDLRCFFTGRPCLWPVHIFFQTVLHLISTNGLRRFPGHNKRLFSF